MWIALFGLVLSSFLSATLLPGSSEVALLAFLSVYFEQWHLALIVATIGNSAGSCTSYFLTRFIPHKQKENRAVRLLQKYGSPLLFFSFVPIVGDALPLAAGWLHLNFYKCLVFIVLGKFIRYGFIVWAWYLIK